MLGVILLSYLATETFEREQQSAQTLEWLNCTTLHIHFLFVKLCFQTTEQGIWFGGWNAYVNGIPHPGYKSTRYNSEKIASNDKRETQRMKDKQFLSTLELFVYVGSFPSSQLCRSLYPFVVCENHIWYLGVVTQTALQLHATYIWHLLEIGEIEETDRSSNRFVFYIYMLCFIW